MNLREYKNKQMKNLLFKEEYEKFDLAFEIGLLIMKARIRKGLTQEKLAQLIKTKQSSIARAENGSSLPSLSFLVKIAQALKTYLIVNFGFLEKETRVEIKDFESAHDMTQFETKTDLYPFIEYNLLDQGIVSDKNEYKFLGS